jgi:hypothetical protein
VTGTLECGTHGTVRPAFVCCHLVDTLRDDVPRGLLWSRDEDGNVNAYCDACDQMLEAGGGEWTDELGAQAKVKIICESCFGIVESINSRRAGS